MSKYDRLANWLAANDGDRIDATFADISKALASPLAPSGQQYQAFWSNPTVTRPLASVGWRAQLRAAEGLVRFIRIGTRSPRALPEASPGPQTAADLVLLGCVKTKLPGRHKAKDLYTSPLFKGRRQYAERSGVPWFILSAKHGLVAPDEEIDSYDVSLVDQPSAERAEWSRRVLAQIDTRLGDLRGKKVEIHAGLEYRDAGVERGLRARGAQVVIPLAGAGIGQQISWYQHGSPGSFAAKHASGAPGTSPIPSFSATLPSNGRDIARTISADFYERSLDLSRRPGAPAQGWSAMPESIACLELVAVGATAKEIRTFLTLMAAMDRARLAEPLWRSGTALFKSQSWVFQPLEAIARPLFHLRDALATSGVSQRHGPDSAAWRLILEALASDDSPAAVRRAIADGEGDARELLQAASATRSSGQPWFPFLGGPKISAMWVRMLADPGEAKISNIGVLPVAVDVQVRKVTEYLGLTQTAGRPLEAVRREIQDVWMATAPAAVGPPALVGTSAALDPAIWFFGSLGCTQCERARKRVPISSVCANCRYEPNV